MEPTINLNLDSLFGKPAVDDLSQVSATGNQPPPTLTNKTIDEPFSSLGNTFQKVLSETESTPTERLVYPKELTEKYKGTALYSPWMDPYADNEKIAAENFSTWDAISAGLGGLLDNAKIAGKAYANSWLRTGRALLTLDASYLGPPPESELLGIAQEQQQVNLDNPIYYAPGTENDIFSKQFLADALKNTGFTFGTMGAFIAETALLGGIGKMTSALPRLFKVGAAAKSTELAKISAQAMSPMAKSEALKAAAENIGRQISGKDLWTNALNVASKLPIVGHAADAARIARAGNTIGLTTQELLQIGAGGLKRSFAEWNFAASEAAIEAGGTYGDIYDSLVKAHYDQYGEYPTNEQLDRIRDDAMKAATQGYGGNLAILAISNRIQFANIFRKIGVDGKFLNMMRNEGDRVFTVMGKDLGGKFATKSYSRGFLGALGHYGDITQKFGKAAFARAVGADLARGLSKFQLVEGLQENVQEGLNEFLKDYYTDLYDDNIATWSDSFNEAVESQSWFGDNAGFKTFLQGALTGFFIAPVTSAVESTVDAFNSKANANHKKALENTLNTLNTFYSNPSNVLKESVASIKKQFQYNEQMVDSAAKGRKYEYFNNKDSALIELALHAKRTGSFDAFKTYISSLGTQMTDTEFTEATGLDLKEINESPASYMNNLAAQLDRYSQIYDKYNMMFGDYLTLDTITSDPAQKLKYSVAQAALRDAIQTVAFNEAKAQESTMRAKSIVQRVASVEAIGQSASSNFNTIVDFDKISEQIIILESEISTLEEGGDKSKATKDLIADKKAEIEELRKWGDNFFKEIQVADEGVKYMPIDYQKLSGKKKAELSNILANYYRIKNKQSNISAPIMAADVASVLQDINDYQKLDRDSREYIEAVNILTNPDNSLKVIQNYANARVAAYARHAYSTYTKLAEISDLFKKYVEEEPQELEALLKIAKSSNVSLDSVDKVKDHLANLNKMTAEQRKLDAEKVEEFRTEVKDTLNKALENQYGDISSMTDAEQDDWIAMHYEIAEGTNVLERYYIDTENNKKVTHTFTFDEIGGYFKIKDFTSLIEDQFNAYVFEFSLAMEQKLYNEFNGVSGLQVDLPVIEEELIYQTKKIKKLVGQKVMRNGLLGVIAVEEDKYVIKHDDGTTSILAPLREEDTTFIWKYDDSINNYRLQEVLLDGVQDVSIDNLSEVTLVPDNLSAEAEKITGVTRTSETVVVNGKSQQIDFVDDNSLKINGKLYMINRDDATNAIVSLEYSSPEGSIFFSAARAKAKPEGADAIYLAAVNNYFLKKTSTGDLNGADLDAAIDGINQTSTNDGAIIRPVAEPLVDETTMRAMELVEGRNLTDEIAQIYDDFLVDSSQVPLNQKQKLYDWALDTVEKLYTLDSQNPTVKDYIEILNEDIINQLYKSDGFTSTRKQPKRVIKKEAKAAEAVEEPKPRADQPSAPAPDSTKTPEGTKEYITSQYKKKAAEKARRIDEFFKNYTGQTAQFTASSKKTAKATAKFTKVDYDANITEAKVEVSPFTDPDIINDINSCNT